MKQGKKNFFISGIIILLAIGFLGFKGIQDGMTYYHEVNEILGLGNSVYDQNVRVTGIVVPGSLEQETGGTTLRFTIIDNEGEESLPVVYQGVVPDTFKVGNEVVVEGSLSSGGTFQAHTLMPKCASKYVPEG
ncbi:cytochrome c maturation protein CcmE [Chloroflexota bacterium]